MKDLLVLILVTLLSPIVLAQQTFYTTGLGNGAWHDSKSWTLTKDTDIPAGPPSPYDNVVINHYLTHFAPANYTHYGKVKVNKGATYEIIVNQEEGAGYQYAGKLFDVYGTLISSGNFFHQLSGSTNKGLLIFRSSSQAYFTKDLILDGDGQVVINHASCGAGQSFRDIQFRNETVQIHGYGTFILSGRVRAWNKNGVEALNKEAANKQAKNQMGMGFSLFASGADCEQQNPFLTGTANLQLDPSLLQIRAVRRGSNVEVSWRLDDSGLADYFILERSSDAIQYENIEQVTGQSEDFSNEYQAKDNRPLKNTSYYRVRQFDLLGQETLSEPFVLSSQPFMNVYPNPSTGRQLSLDISGFEANTAVEVSINTLMGQEVSRQSLQADASGSLRHEFQQTLMSGNYIIHATTSYAHTTQLLLVR